MASELKPCPFCGGTDVNLHHSAKAFMSWVSCKSCGLDAPSETGVTDEEAITYWNTRPAPADLKARDRKRYKLIRKSLQNKGLLPAATDTGLVTVGYAHRGTIGLLLEGAVSKAVIVPKAGGEFKTPVMLVEQAEELLAAERAKTERWHQKAMDAGVISHSDGTTSHPMRKERDDLKADNAALTARVKADELKILKLEERLSAEQASHEQSGKSRDEWRGKAEALEAKLAAANEVAQLVIQAEEDKSGDPNFYILMMQTAYDKARAVLGGKP